MKLYTARWLLDPAGDARAGGGVLVARGRIVRRPGSPRAVVRAAREAGAEIVDLGEGALTPGLVNAHAHLELTGLRDRVGRGESFRAWLDRVIACRRSLGQLELARGARHGADRLVATGTTTVGDIDPTGASERELARHPLRARLFREVLDGGDPRRAADAARRVRRALPDRAGIREGLSPHAPYSVSPELFARLGRIARRRGVPVTIHWSETASETEWLRHGRGELAGLVRHSPRRTGLDLIEEAGLLTSSTALVHGNHPERGEALRLARAGASLVHCPGSHAFFGREPFPLHHYLERGVSVALGTDSHASNDDLDMRREMALLRANAGWLAPEEVFRMTTLAGARALGLEREVGTLAPGGRADFCLFRTVSDDPRGCLEEVTAECPAVGGVWIGGRPVRARPPARAGFETGKRQQPEL